MHKRKIIRDYATALLKQKVDIGERVFANRPSPLLLEEIPCICIYFDNESNEIFSGDKYNPKSYQRSPQLSIDILNDDPIDPDASPEKSQANEDFLDNIAWQVERAFDDDKNFAKLLPNYNPENICDGLLWGLSLTNTTPYIHDSDGDRRVLATKLSYTLYYETDATISDKKYKNFEVYNNQILKADADSETIDPILIEANGDV